MNSLPGYLQDSRSFFDLSKLSVLAKSWYKTDYMATERAAEVSLLKTMCPQRVRKQLRNQQAGKSGLFRQPFLLSEVNASQIVFLQVIKKNIHTTTASCPCSFSKISGTGTREYSSKISETGKVFKRSLIFHKHPVSSRSRNLPLE